jgi:hypothetical protein
MSTKAKTLDDFMRDNDRDTIISSKIEAGLKAMAKIGPQEHNTETDFAKLCGLQLVEVAKARDKAKFVKHVAFVPKLLGRKARYVWFADSKVVPAKFRYTPEKANG